MTVGRLLPRNATPLELRLAETGGRFSPDEIVPTLWNAETCPVEVLPFLAWSLSVDEWDPAWSVDKKRSVIAAARYIHQHKGTPSAIRRALSSLGQDDAELIERSDFIRCDGSVTANGDHSCGGQWATYRIVLKQPVTVPEAYQIKRLLAAVGRNCVHLQSIEFAAAAFRCDGTIICDGTYSCGAVDTTIN